MAGKAFTRLLFLLTVVVGLGLLIFFIQRYQVTRMNQTVLGRAAEAEKDGKFEEAARLYEEHLELNPKDEDAKASLADVLQKGPKSSARLDQAIVLYTQVLMADPGKRDVRRRVAELLVERGLFPEARDHLQTLVDRDNEKDGTLLLLLARCLEATGDTKRAGKTYEKALERLAEAKGPELLDAYQRFAALLRGPLEKPEEADRIIGEMIKSEPENPQAYLASGRYYLQSDKDPAKAKAKEYFEQAIKKAPATPEAYSNLATIALLSKKPEEAHRLLKAALDLMPKEASLYLAQARLETQSGKPEEAIAALRRGLEQVPDEANLHWDLAGILADRGETARLWLEIEELRRLKVSPPLVEFLEAYHQVNLREWAKARQTLVRLQPIFDQYYKDFKTGLNHLLARCYRELGDRDRGLAASELAAEANPDSVAAQILRANNLLERGEYDQAIAVYEKLEAGGEHQFRLPLARLLIHQNLQRPVAEQEPNWSQVEKLIQDASKDSLQSSEPIIVRAELLAAQGKEAEALGLLEKERARNPRAIGVWIKLAEFLRKQGKFDTEQKLLDQAEESVHQEVRALREEASKAPAEEAKALRARAEESKKKLADVRIEKGRLLIAKGGPDAAKTLRELLADLSDLPRASAPKVIETLALESAALNDPALTKDLWAEAAKLDPNKLEPQIRLLELAFQSKDKDKDAEQAIEGQLDKIRAIDGRDGFTSQYLECRYLLWKAAKLDSEADRQERDRLRTAARNQLDELRNRRADASMIPLTLAALAEQEAAELQQQSADAELVKKKKEEAAVNYLKSVQLGQRNLAVIQKAFFLLTELGDAQRQDQLLNLLPASVRRGLDKLALTQAVNRNDADRAIELARHAVQDRPNDLQARLWLVQLLEATRHFEDAEKVLREGDPQINSPDLQRELVLLLVKHRKLDEAERAFRTAEERIRGQVPMGLLALARSCEVIAKGHKEFNQDLPRSEAWIETARGLYAAAEKEKPEDFEVVRQYVNFQLRAEKGEAARGYLTRMLEDKGANPRPADQVAWARRALAEVLLLKRDQEQNRQALDWMRPVEGQLQLARAKKAEFPKPEELRILANVYEAQRTPASHQEARKVLEDLVGSGAGSPEDRLVLAGLYNADHEWAKAQEQYDRLIADSELARDLETLSRRPEYLVRYLTELLKRYESESKEPELLSRAQALVEKLRQLQPDSLGCLAFQARLLIDQNQRDQAAELIEKPTREPRLKDIIRLALAKQAEDLSLTEAAERIYRETLQRTDTPQNRLALAVFLARHGKAREGLNLCEPLWDGKIDPESFIGSVMEIAFAAANQGDPTAIDRIAGRVEQSLNVKPRSPVLLTALGNLRERQKHFQEAEDLYRRAIDKGGGNMTALNNLAWLMVLLDDKTGNPLELINRAVERHGLIPDLLDTRGVVYLKSGDANRAIDDLKRAIDLDPSAPRYFHLAQAYLQARNRKNAAETLTEAHKKGLKSTDLHPLEEKAYKEVHADLGMPQ
jgi:tetratricopeptide (TPR) repeat protein